MMLGVLGCGRHVDVLERVEGSASASATSVGSSSDLDDSGAESSPPSDLPPAPDCAVPLPMGEAPPCGPSLRDEPITPVLEWSWDGVGPDRSSITTPLVASMTDDDSNGIVDACDTPDLVVVAYATATDGAARLYLLDGASGGLHNTASVEVDARTTPALGDLDGDRVPEIVTVAHSGELIVIGAGGERRTSGDAAESGAPIALADLDGDGVPEILHPAGVYDAEARLRWAIDPPQNLVAADADGDGTLELLGGRGFHHDGTSYYDAGIMDGWPQIADLDDDLEIEIVVVHENGVAILDHAGVLIDDYLYPTVTPRDPVLAAPAAIADFDGDGAREIATRSATSLLLLERDGMPRWIRPAGVGTSGPVGFDLLGTGAALVLLGETTRVVAYDAMGAERFSLPRSSTTLIDIPVVADVDADGAAEIVVVNDEGMPSGTPHPLLQVYGDDTHWVGARRVWNQHAYAVGNVQDDGTIPSPTLPSWRPTNSFRTNARVVDGTICGS
jgi:hypothetical protein